MKKNQISLAGISILLTLDEREAYLARYHGAVSSASDPRRLVFNILGTTCACCGTREALTIDHRTPLSRLKQPRETNIYLQIWFGLLPLDNLQTLCRTCNSGKGADDECKHRVIARHVVQLMKSEQAA